MHVFLAAFVAGGTNSICITVSRGKKSRREPPAYFGCLVLCVLLQCLFPKKVGRGRCCNFLAWLIWWWQTVGGGRKSHHLLLFGSFLFLPIPSDPKRELLRSSTHPPFPTLRWGPGDTFSSRGKTLEEKKKVRYATWWQPGIFKIRIWSQRKIHRFFC